VNYEDAPLIAPDDLIDVAVPTSRGSGRTYTLFAMPVTVQTDLPSPAVLAKQEETDGLAARAQQRAAVEAILGAYKRSGNHGSFTFSQNGRYIDVYPDKMRNERGIYVPFEPMLSTRVSIPEGRYRLDQLLWLVCDQLTQKRGFPIIHGTIPTATFLSITLSASAKDEPARDVLKNAFEDTKAIRASQGAYDVRYFRWALLYDADIQSYGMNILWTSKDLPGVTDPTKYRPGQPSEPHQWVQQSPTKQN
jgi:hypothetical protein